jgi:23S rRNA pseudouridine2605 synthase
VRVLRASGRQSVVEIVLHEGRKRQVRRMCEAVGHHVLGLHRSAYAGLRLGTLPQGSSRSLLPHEIELLRSASGDA